MRPSSSDDHWRVQGANWTRFAMTVVDFAGRLFAVGTHVRYVAIRQRDALYMAAREGLPDASSEESDRYEELLVNPTLLTLAEQRGRIDCGGLEFVLVGYGSFRQLVMPIPGGHVSVALELDAVSVDSLETIVEIVAQIAADGT